MGLPALGEPLDDAWHRSPRHAGMRLSRLRPTVSRPSGCADALSLGIVLAAASGTASAVTDLEEQLQLMSRLLEDALQSRVNEETPCSVALAWSKHFDAV